MSTVSSELKLEPVAASSGTTPARGFEVLSRRRIYILPTRQGVAFGGMLVVMLLGSANYNNGLGYALSFLLSSLGLVSLVHTYRNLAGLGVRLNAGAPSFLGRPATFTMTIDNRQGVGRPAVLARLRPVRRAQVAPPGLFGRFKAWRQRRKQPDWSADVITQSDLSADALETMELAVNPGRRGWFEVERVVIATRFPFGLFRAWSVLRADARALVYPAPEGNLSFPHSGSAGRAESGDASGGEDDFAGLREYVAGDSWKRVHWKALAREQGLQVKQFSGGAPSEVVLNWSDTVGPTEVRISQLTRWVVEADAAGHQFTLVLGDESIGPGRGTVHREAALRALALYRLPGDAPEGPGGEGAWTGGV